MSQRPRLRDLGLTIGHYPPGPFNAITDVPGVWVGHATLIYDEPRAARTGVTVILPREDASRENHVFAGYFSFNGNGEMTGLPWIDESGMIGGPIGLTNTNQVGAVRDAFIEYAVQYHRGRGFRLPVVAETWDGWLSDIDHFHLTKDHVFEALFGAKTGPVAEGNVGGGTGMICHEFKGGIGTASRVVTCPSGTFTVGALVQANHGDRLDLRVDGVPVGQEVDARHTPYPWAEPLQSSSVIVVLATDAPLLPGQCTRLAKRATVGFARVGGVGHNGSGDIFLAFATGNAIPHASPKPYDLKMVPHEHLDPLFVGAAEAVEEAILNCLTAAETMTGQQGRKAYALPLDELVEIMNKYSRKNG